MQPITDAESALNSISRGHNQIAWGAVLMLQCLVMIAIEGTFALDIPLIVKLASMAGFGLGANMSAWGDENRWRGKKYLRSLERSSGPKR